MLFLEKAVFNNLSRETSFLLVHLASRRGMLKDGHKFLKGFFYSHLWEEKRDNFMFHQTRRNMASAGGSIVWQQHLLKESKVVASGSECHHCQMMDKDKRK